MTNKDRKFGARATYCVSAGSAMAEEGRRVYVVGGRVSVQRTSLGQRDSIGMNDRAPRELTAEVFELDLGDRPLATGQGTSMFQGISTAHWRQVRYL